MSLVITDEKKETFVNVTAESTWAILCIDPERHLLETLEAGCVRLYVDGKKFCLGDNRSYEQLKKEVQYLMATMAKGAEGLFVFTNEDAPERSATLGGEKETLAKKVFFERD